MYMAVSITWAILFFTGAIQLWHACVLLIIHGMAGVLWSPGSQLLIHDIVGPDHLQSAVRLNATSRQLGVLLGPAVGGGLMLLLGPSAGLLVNAALYLPLSIWLLLVPYTGHRDRKTASARPALSVRDAINVMREASTHPTILSMILLGGATSLLVGNAFQAQMPEFAADLGHGDADVYYSMLLAANAAGALTAGVILESRGVRQAEPRIAFALVILWSLCMGGFAVSTVYLLSLALLFAAGFLNLAFGAMSQTLVQIHAPPAIRGRVIGLYGTSFNGMRAFSGVTVGMGGSLVGVHWSLAISAVVLLVVTAGLYVFERRTEAP
jgi:MFS family permease